MVVNCTRRKNDQFHRRIIPVKELVRDLRSEVEYEWLGNWQDLKASLEDLIPKDASILLIGCGNSRLPVDMAEDGYHGGILSTDYSGTVIERMREKHGDSPRLSWAVEDMRSLSSSLADASFDVVVDKAAMDALLAVEGDQWDPPNESREVADQVCSSVTRVLRVGGVFLQVSFSQPHFRRPFLNAAGNGLGRYGWEVTTRSLDLGLGYFLYIMRKARDPDPDVAAASLHTLLPSPEDSESTSSASSGSDD